MILNHLIVNYFKLLKIILNYFDFIKFIYLNFNHL